VLPEQAAAVADLRTTFADHTVIAIELPDGRTWVTLKGVEVGPEWTPPINELSVYLNVTVGTPPYPFYAAAGLARADCRTFSPVNPSVQIYDGTSRSQLSLTKGYDSATEGLGARFAAVIHWLHYPR